jgi:hypothetical protein
MIDWPRHAEGSALVIVGEIGGEGGGDDGGAGASAFAVSLEDLQPSEGDIGGFGGEEAWWVGGGRRGAGGLGGDKGKVGEEG